MKELDLERIEEWLQRFDTTLGDAGLKRDLIETDLEKPVPIKFEGATFTLDGKAGIEVFNSPDDEDGDGVLVAGQTEEPGLDRVAPQLSFDGGKAWLKYRASASAKGSARRDLGQLGFSLDGEAGVVLSSYRVHRRDEKLRDAVLADLQAPRTVLSFGQIRDMQVGEAVSMQVRGRLDGSLTLRWADVFASQMSLLGGLLGVNETFGIEVSSGLSADLAVHVEDDFVLVFSRPDEHRIRVAVRKAKQRSVAARLSASIGVEFTDPDAVKNVLGRVTRGLLGETKARIDRLLSKALVDELTQDQLDLARNLLARLGVDVEPVDLDRLRQAWADLEAKTEDVVRRVAEAKAKVGFTYEYSRLRSNTSVLQATLDNAKVPQYHASLVKGNIRELLADLVRGRAGLQLETYLNENTLRVRRAWGFTLGVDKWSVASREIAELEEVIRVSGQRRQVSFRGFRGYRSKWGDDKVELTVDFDAAMDDFSLAEQPAADEFRYGLHLAFRWTEKRLRTRELPGYVDHAVIWRAVARGDASTQVEELQRALENQRGVEIACQITLTHDAFRWVLPRIADDDNRRFADALGEAMPWLDSDPQVHQSIELRRRYYGALWKKYLDDDTITPRLLQGTAEASFRNWQYRKVANFEGRGLERFRLTSIAGLAAMHPRIRTDWQSFRSGAGRLRDAIERKGPMEEIRRAYRAMNDLWNQSLYVRALGVLVLDAAREGDAHVRDGVERVMTITYTAGNQERVRNIGLS